ncbi:MAG: cyclic nucleotide-binding domain-containing protein [Magnetovibrionaceae bacterium]
METNRAHGVLERSTYQPGAYVFRDGDEGDRAYVVQQGTIEIVKDIDGELKVLGEIGKGGIFGEMALLDNKRRMASARAKEGVTLIVVTRMMFNAKMEKADPFLRGLLLILADHVRRLSEQQ